MRLHEFLTYKNHGRVESFDIAGIIEDLAKIKPEQIPLKKMNDVESFLSLALMSGGVPNEYTVQMDIFLEEIRRLIRTKHLHECQVNL